MDLKEASEVALIATSIWTFWIAAISGIRAWIEWKTYKTS